MRDLTMLYRRGTTDLSSGQNLASARSRLLLEVSSVGAPYTPPQRWFLTAIRSREVKSAVALWESKAERMVQQPSSRRSFLVRRTLSTFRRTRPKSPKQNRPGGAEPVFQDCFRALRSTTSLRTEVQSCSTRRFGNWRRKRDAAFAVIPWPRFRSTAPMISVRPRSRRHRSSRRR